MNNYEEWFILAKSKLRLAYDAVNDEEVHHNRYIDFFNL